MRVMSVAASKFQLQGSPQMPSPVSLIQVGWPPAVGKKSTPLNQPPSVIRVTATLTVPTTEMKSWAVPVMELGKVESA